MIRVPIPKEHPYQSHISRFALFPTFRSPDDPDTGVRAASQRPLNPLVPASAPQVTVLRKTKGSVCLCACVEIQCVCKSVWVCHPRPVTGDAETQVFYPMALKSVFPNPSLRDWGVTLSERTANTLHNLEKSLWATSYQLDFTGSGPSNPLRMDDFHEKTIAMITGKMTPYTAQLVCTVTTNLMNKRERSHPILLPPKPGDGRKARIGQERRVLQSTDPPPTVNSAAESQPAALTSHHGRSGPLGALTHHNRSGPLGGYGYNETLVNDFTQDYRLPNNSQNHTEPSLDIGRKLLPPHPKEPAEVTKMDTQNELCHGDIPCRKNDSYRVGTENRTARITGLETDVPAVYRISPNAQNVPLSENLVVNFENTANQTSEIQDQKRQNREITEIPCSISNPCIQPRPPVLPSTQPGEGGGVLAGGGNAPNCRHQSSLLELQDSFSKSEVHRRFRSSLQGGPVNLQDNVHAGRKHHFYGFNSYYFHD
ncbi:uncharacterized protein C7orf31 homolog [Esox lucius]|uniref:uncharacterized protein C7orf31 homolog n=1 Tax=Esox lucius TaxID=8010 RepID=UPI0014769108|nr:uncharacterized protein C7orf31 homolog [Esox lucius]